MLIKKRSVFMIEEWRIKKGTSRKTRLKFKERFLNRPQQIPDRINIPKCKQRDRFDLLTRHSLWHSHFVKEPNKKGCTSIARPTYQCWCLHHLWPLKSCVSTYRGHFESYIARLIAFFSPPGYHFRPGWSVRQFTIYDFLKAKS